MRRLGFALIVLAGCGSSNTTMICDAAALTAALAAASAGEVVQVGACSIDGSFTVPAGVTLNGDGPALSSITSAAGSIPVRLTPGALTRLSNLTIIAFGPAGVTARGAGSAAIEHVVVNAELGVAIGGEDLTELELEDVRLSGPITPDNAIDVPYPATTMDTATHGLVLVHVARAVISELSISGFASVGALFVESSVDWSRGSSSDNLGIAIAAEGGTVSISDVDACRNLQGFRLLPAFGAVFAANAAITTARFRACDNEGYGVFQDSGTLGFSGYEARGNEEPGLWVQSAQGAEVSGTFDDNGFAGIVAVDTTGLNVHDAQIDNTRLAVTIFLETGALRVGDGIHLVRSSTAASLANLQMSGNERTGVLVELDGGVLGANTFNNVSITVTATTAHGVVVQGGPMPPVGWDTTVTRVGTTAMDDALVGRLEHVEAVGPCERPADSGLSAGGLTVLVGP